jgi:hypothetical protein
MVALPSPIGGREGRRARFRGRSVTNKVVGLRHGLVKDSARGGSLTQVVIMAGLSFTQIKVGEALLLEVGQQGRDSERLGPSTHSWRLPLRLPRRLKSP